MITKLSDLTEKTQNKAIKTIAVAAAGDYHVLLAIKEAVEQNIILPILIGDVKLIKEIALSIDFNVSDIELINCERESSHSAIEAVRLIREGRADILMKGLVPTGDLMRAVLDKENGLRKSQVLSHVAFFQSPYYHKLLCVTDAAMNIAPDFQTKVDILNNAVQACTRLGITLPKVAVAAAVEQVNPKMEATLHASMLKDMNLKNEIADCIVDGPFAIDIAVNKNAASHKKIVSKVAGDADIILAPDIEAGNMFYKALNFLGGAQSASVIMGASAPIVLTSRSDDATTKFYSIVLAASMD